MKRMLWIAPLAVAVLGAAVAAQDDFRREGKPERRTLLAPLEGDVAPALSVTDWMNTRAGGLRLAKLRGKVVLLKFWGVW